MAKNKKSSALTLQNPAARDNADFISNIITNWLGALGVLIALSFFLHTQDSAQIKITLFYAGACGVFALWLSGLFAARADIFTKNNLKKLLPFLVYFVYILLSYFLAPRFLGRGGSFVYFLSFSAVFAVAAFTCGAAQMRKIFSFIIAACWLIFGYGILQIINIYLLPGADPLFWSDFFGKRIFSTFSNPNFYANFCLFAIIIITARFLQTRSKKLLALLALGLVNIFFTESKGAWLALGVSGALFAAVYFNYFTAVFKKNKFAVTAVLSAALLLAIALTAFYGAKRMRSVSFRLHTWAAAAQMVKEKPLFGHGAGSFFIEYPAFKKPEIFKIEQIHNAQTTHAENHYLELLATLGFAGFALFAWCAFYLCAGVYRKLKSAPSYELLAAAGALGAIYIHNFVDISLYLPSTGYFAALLAGGVFNLAYGPLDKEQAPASGKGGAVFYILAAIAVVLFAAIAVFMLGSFAEITRGGFGARPLNALINWIFFIFTIAAVCFIFASVIFKYKKIMPVIILCAASVLMYIAWFGVKAGNYVSIAGALAERGDINNAIAYYARAIKYDRFESSFYQFRAIMFTQRMDMSRAGLYNDYDRAQMDYEMTESLNPGEPLLYYNWGTAQFTAALKSNPQAAARLYEAALVNLKKAQKLDPVYQNIQLQIAGVEAAMAAPQAARAANL